MNIVIENTMTSIQMSPSHLRLHNLVNKDTKFYRFETSVGIIEHVYILLISDIKPMAS